MKKEEIITQDSPDLVAAESRDSSQPPQNNVIYKDRNSPTIEDQLSL